MAIEKNERWVNFINLYKNLPELWNVKSDKYKNKRIRAAAYKKLTNEYKNIDENATTEKVKNRIRNMRFTYTRELKKKMASEKREAGVEQLYEPNLWYFDEFNFLKEFVQPAEDAVSSDNETISPVLKKTAKRQRNLSSQERSELLRKATMHMENLRDKNEREEADVYGEAWACSYRKLTNSKKLLAKKACDEIFILGQLGKLSLNTVRTEKPLSGSSCSYSSLPHIISGQSTPVIINSATLQTYHEAATSLSQDSQCSAFTEILSDNSFS